MVAQNQLRLTSNLDKVTSPLFAYEVKFNYPLVLASGTAGQANTEVPEGIAPSPGTDDLAGTASSEQDSPSLSCSSNDKEGSAKVETSCSYHPDSQSAPYTQPALISTQNTRMRTATGE